MLRSLTFLSLFLISSVGNTAEPSWTYITIGEMQSKGYDGLDPSGSYLDASLALNSKIYLSGLYHSPSGASNGHVERITSTLGLGFRKSTNKNTDAYVQASALNREINIDHKAFSDETGYELRAGLRSRVKDNFELGAALIYEDVTDDSIAAIKFDAGFFFATKFSFGLTYREDEDADTKAAYFRFSL